jgi:uncharacterized protein (DUF488 family)
MDRSKYLPIFTIGHSLHAQGMFSSLLRQHHIDVLLDVRSSPFSRRSPQFNRQHLKTWLNGLGIRYSFGGRTLGGRPEDPSLYVRGQASYERMAAIDSFIASLRRIAIAARTTRVVLLCAEADPIECHRFLLVGRCLHARGFDLRHILSNGRLESHSQAEQRMMAVNGLQQADAFSEGGDSLATAYERQAARFAFVQPGPSTYPAPFEPA